MGRLSGVTPYHDDMISIFDRLPSEEECRHARHIVLEQPDNPNIPNITDDQVAGIVAACPDLESIVLCGVPDTTDKTVVLLAKTTVNLQGINLTGCQQVTDVGVLELISKSVHLQWIELSGVVGLTDPSISAIGKTCSRLVELGLSDLPLLTALSVRDVWSFSRKLRTLRLARCPLLTDKAFPSLLAPNPPLEDDGEKPLPPMPTTWLEHLPPLNLRHTAENLRVLDLASCRITDDAIEGIVAHAPKIQSLTLSSCNLLTDRSLECICKLGSYLDVLMLAHVANITDRGVVQLTRSCMNLRYVDVSFCRNLTDMSVFELAGLRNLRRLSLVRVHKLTDIGIFSLAEHAESLESLHLSYCDRLSLDAMHLLLKKLVQLQHLTATGVPSFKRKGIQRFSEPPPTDFDPDQQAAFRVFNGENISRLRRFLDKEEQRRRGSEAKNIPFVARADDKLDLY